MKIVKLTGLDIARKAIAATSRQMSESTATLDMIYRWEHSPIRTQLFWVEMHDIPTFVSVHLVRHKIGVEHFVQSNRKDRGGDDDVDRNTPVNHAMLINAQSLINMCRDRLCYQASPETRKVVEDIKAHIWLIDQALYKYLVPECIYRGGNCPQPKPCGVYNVRKYNPEEVIK